MENSKKLELVFIPCPLPGHLVSTMEFANRLISHHPRLEVTILLMKSAIPSSKQQEAKADDDSNSSDDPFPDYNNKSSTNESIRYVNLPVVVLPPMQLFYYCPEDYISTYIASHKPHVRAAIDAASHHPAAGKLAGIVIDMFGTSLIDVANDLGVPSYLFFASGAAYLGILLHVPTLNIQFNKLDDGSDSISTDSDTDFSISTFSNQVPSDVLPAAFMKKSGFKVFSYLSKRFTETKGMIVNTFSELEPYATKSLMINTQIPHVYTVGPLLNLNSEAHGQPNKTQKERIMTWLDNQPDSSVLFLCFGSAGSFSETQTKEIATGLEKSGVRFIWSLRKPQTVDKVAEPGEYTEKELNHMLPSGFMSCLEERRGLLCGWAPQVEVLAHRGVGGFVSHCGWNSILESLWFGVPIVTWPLYAEQQCNAFQIVEELGLGVELKLNSRRERVKEISRRDGSDNLLLVTAHEIRNAIGCVMDPDNQVRKKVKEISKTSKQSLLDGDGSSFKAIECLLRDMEKNLED